MRKLSVVTICYNEPNLEKTCKSIVNQTWQDFEWIVIDGGSNQETLDIFEKYKYRIDKFVSEPDNGIYHACNKGIRLAECEWINFINAGDAYHSSDILENVFSNTYSADVLYGEQYQIYADVRRCRSTKLPDHVDCNFFIHGNIPTPATFIKRNLFEECGLFNEEMKIASDYEKWLVFLKKGKVFKHLDYIVADFDMNGISSNQKNADLHRLERRRIVAKYFTEKEIISSKKLSFLERIFSLTNVCSRKYKMLTILGSRFIVWRERDA